jgi:hypothetical protein
MLTPIETLYAGCRFRSRLEARWAVFFDVFQLKWRYEPDGFRLPSGRCYLPDFLIDGVGFVEIKPTTDSDNGKIVELGDMLQTINMKAYCIYGDVPNPLDIEPWGFGPWNPPDGGIYAADDDSPEYWFAICPKCHCRGITYQARYARLSCGCFKELLSQPDGDRVWNDNIARIHVALVAARSARFEEYTRKEVP